MSDGDDAFDVILLIGVLMIFTPIMIYLSIPLFKGDVGGFNYAIEKTALQTESEIVPTPRDYTTEDLILMMVVADRYSPNPKTLQVAMGGAVENITIDAGFIADRAPGLQRAAAAIPVMGAPIDLELFVGSTGPRFWQANPR